MKYILDKHDTKQFLKQVIGIAVGYYVPHFIYFFLMMYAASSQHYQDPPMAMAFSPYYILYNIIWIILGYIIAQFAWKKKRYRYISLGLGMFTLLTLITGIIFPSFLYIPFLLSH